MISMAEVKEGNFVFVSEEKVEIEDSETIMSSLGCTARNVLLLFGKWL